jgi:hypothetical protein
MDWARILAFVTRLQRRAEVAQQSGARLDDVGNRPKRFNCLNPYRTVAASRLASATAFFTTNVMPG